MIIKTIAPEAALNNVFLKESLKQEHLNDFKASFTDLLTQLDATKGESEEFYKNIIADFLKQKHFYPDTIYKVNVSERKDLVIRKTNEPVLVIFEAKQPNHPKMISVAKPNADALHKLILYYLQERIEKQNIAIKHLIATDIYNWYIFDETVFDKHFYNNPKFREGYKAYKSGKKKTKDFFEYVEQLLNEGTVVLECTYFNLTDFKKATDTDLMALYKILSPVHLLKLPIANDSNQLDKNFYLELLHIIGLEEVKDGSKKLIRRKTQPDPYSLLENTIAKLENSGLRKVENVLKWGQTREEQLFNIALELSLTWVNRVLFLKLLEAQLIAYHRGNSRYAFLHSELIYDYPRLNTLFFQVLAEHPSNRTRAIQIEFENIPYLNSSLFEITELEDKVLQISNLDNRKTISIFQQTVLKNDAGKPKMGVLDPLNYLFAFLEAYNFASEGTQTIQEDHRNLINASVLGLIFEKINGYKDGSFFTPGFITMYMCRETIRRAVVQKFKTSGFEADTFEALKAEIAERKQVKQANIILNSLKICDPAVGSGHFLVSALNEMLAIKFDLGVLLHRDGSRVSDVLVQVEKDELKVTDEDSGELFQYFINEKGLPPQKRQRLQETLFHEKQTIIENCLFGVDINPNSVKICRLRLWIELLKHAYYRPSDDKALNFKALETLPNIDINIKEGNSLMSKLHINDAYNRFDTARRQKIRNLVPIYKAQVDLYKSVKDKTAKAVIQKRIDDCSTTLHGLYNPDDKDYIAWKTKETEWLRAEHASLFLKDEANIEKLKTESERLEAKYKNKIQIFHNAFEWRFAFPEVLDADGAFVGFDIIIGNPPYGVKFSNQEKTFFDTHYKTTQYNYESYAFFYERSTELLKNGGFLDFITPNTFLVVEKSNLLRDFLFNQHSMIRLLETFNVFADAVVEPILCLIQKKKPLETHTFRVFTNPRQNENSIEILNCLNPSLFTQTELNEGELLIFNYKATPIERKLLNKIALSSQKLSKFAKVVAGVKPYEVGKGKPAQTKQMVETKPYTQFEAKDSSWQKLIRGTQVTRYSLVWQGEYLKYGEWLAAPRNKEIFTNPKLFIRRTDDKLLATYDDSGMIGLNSIHCLQSIDSSIDNKYLLALINSKMMNWVFQKMNFHMVGKPLAEVKIIFVERLPVKNISQAEQQPIIALVEQVLASKQASPSLSTTALESAIDAQVYALYELSAADIALIEASVK